MSFQLTMSFWDSLHKDLHLFLHKMIQFREMDGIVKLQIINILSFGKIQKYIYFRYRKIK